MAKWIIVAGLYFFALDLFLPSVIASVLSTVLTAGAFFHPDNYREVQAIKRPIIYRIG